MKNRGSRFFGLWLWWLERIRALSGPSVREGEEGERARKEEPSSLRSSGIRADSSDRHSNRCRVRIYALPSDQRGRRQSHNLCLYRGLCPPLCNYSK